ncbi:hypothetical protein [Lentzea californiensis]|uniref:hypothetical protein n=1 Tax=Lentzea californiensis TaxID=438851 RepID=UPI002165F23F|nr:hypothetical protein [Lentzea californiensis]MCR3753848.1 hypothetical protein [Lentzea californiensis]
MTKTDRSRTAGLAGFATTTALLVLTFAAFQNGALESFGWQGGEYATAFVCITLGSTFAGIVLNLTAPAPWKSVGTGMILAGTLGGVVVIMLFFVIAWGLSNISVP